MKRSISVFLLSALLVFAVVQMSFTQPNKSILADKKMKFQHKMDKGLNLTDEQKTKISDLKLTLQKDILPLKTELQSKMAELRLLKTENNPDLKKIDQSIEESQKIRTKIQKATVRHQLEIRKLLTPEQQKIWDSRTLKGRRERSMGRGFKRVRPHF